ncbi:MAG TPA: cobyrinate a,c-diamide synthase [Intrasporangium sp.]|uniref:cobyrinate a,c-diamide synthase n=1 Tax=Intrasporangium sp. TaxID=1925024 RepID=UPI002D78755F|nr:cobyrinate a,c-diamide synthase [Intrasporangium sp.]HET7399634.1 cobyrinate a,c-diamide synthase [Intrasporangium sp.]
MTGPGLALPRVVVAAPGSGHGKTMLATGIMAALRARGDVVSPHKVGPDYIDPGYHALAAGRPGRNLDPYLQGEHLVAPLLAHAALTPEPATIAVIEGVMGLFDGLIGSAGFSSTAHVARLVQAPVVLVVDCTATARSVGAVVHGFSRFDEAVRVAGVVLNNVASARHEQEARDGVAATGVPVLGCVPRRPDVVVPSRHLGLVPAAERRPEADDAVGALSELVQAHVDLDALRGLAASAPRLDAAPWSAAAAVGEPVPGRPRVAVAAGRAFTFGYAETTELLEAAGADVVAFDPLRDPVLPPGTAGLVIGGGFPEVHAHALSHNASLRDSVTALVRRGGVVAAECAGLLYLGRALQGEPMCGVLPFTAALGPRLTLGYRAAVATVDTLLTRAGERVTGHEFHRTVIEPLPLAPAAEHLDAGAPWAWTAHDGTTVREGFATDRLHASYLHVHWAGHPRLARRFVEAAAASAGEAAA